MADAAAAAPLALHRFEAPSQWRTIELLSDVHLQPEAPRTFDAWCAQMRGSDADAVFILGDLFEAWVGDDSRHDAFEHRVGEVLRETSARKTVAFMPGNRDFMLGEAMLAHCDMRALPDATVLHAFGRRAVLSHGDALCLEDVDYQRFRAMVHSPAWRAAVMVLPLAERRERARAMRDASTAHQAQRSPALWADVDAAAALQLLDAAGSDTLIHGHTHRPGRVMLSPTATRHVLSDWDFDGASDPRGNVIRITARGVRVEPALALSPERG
ncbi:MAG TPA: UDP-2,3-diacylglucosamine diphosphatase [Burkholderiaceae bacterium]|nr:UDP-2,3-diacylglucosamine diphosphatase [Burkholderiaceae bacterium]